MEQLIVAAIYTNQGFSVQRFSKIKQDKESNFIKTAVTAGEGKIKLPAAYDKFGQRKLNKTQL